MIESWRWFGPLDEISLGEVAQSGATGVVTALHDVAYGEVWSIEAIEARRRLIEGPAALGLRWNVVESLPVHDDIKHGSGDLSGLYGNYRQSLANLAACGIKTVCYNFMPVLDWVRTDHDLPVRGGGRALGFNEPLMAGFEARMLGRDDAGNDYAPEVVETGTALIDAMDEEARAALLGRIMAGLPGAYDRYDLGQLRNALARYEGMSGADLRANLARFLDAVLPAAEDLGMTLCIHPDDPPRPVFGLPRIVSTEDDIAWVFAASDSPSNGLTFCSGSLGARAANGLTRIAERFSSRTGFLHLRNVTTEPDGSFTEAAHLSGDADMIGLLRVFLAEEARRRAAGSRDWELPFRPDHGHELGPDLRRPAHPGYPFVGRLRGLAELRGAIAALSARADP
ncbi:MAG: mannonate dehydratase [Paracoccaceae bacterium]|nr:mannonate dehydratase [Paracoccaceae bacterium]